VGGINAAQVGLGVRVAGITTNFQQGAAQLTNRSTDMMISGDGFFMVRKGNEDFYTRAGAFSFDATGQLVTPEGALVQGWAADAAGNIDQNGPMTDLRLPLATLMGAAATSTASFEGNLPDEATVGTVLTRTMDTYDATGNTVPLTITFTRTAAGWDLGATAGAATATGAMTFNADGTLATGGSLTVGPVTVDLSTLTGYAAITSVEALTQNGRAAGTIQSFSINADGTLMGSFSNGLKMAVGQVALATFSNPGGLEKAGNSMYRTTVNSGDPQVGSAGTGGRGDLSGGTLEMSNVDLSAEFTNLIIAQRGFQANSRVITTSDELLQELVNLKR
jgi:flagellar hook protein FlgE